MLVKRIRIKQRKGKLGIERTTKSPNELSSPMKEMTESTNRVLVTEKLDENADQIRITHIFADDYAIPSANDDGGCAFSFSRSFLSLSFFPKPKFPRIGDDMLNFRVARLKFAAALLPPLLAVLPELLF